MHSSEPLVLWCQAVDVKDGKKTPVKLKKAVFRSPVLTYEPHIIGDSTTANLTVTDVPVTAAGRWSCDLETERGNTTGYIEVFLRPIVFSKHAIRIDNKDTSQFHFDGAGVTTLLGQDAHLTCPVLGLPTPKVQWRVSGDSTPIRTGGHYVINGTNLTIRNVTYDHEKVYVCIAMNSFIDQFTKKVMQYDLFLERRLRVKSPIAWLWPLLIILAILGTLIITIAFCECRKRRREQKLLITEPEEND
ncbi:hypothetical protein FO519_001073 [Halicephalobus sp. NKZ332]|nr:hypothetical protein FO519_001073 [Halicephalobus sp. NKZ332]